MAGTVAAAAVPASAQNSAARAPRPNSAIKSAQMERVLEGAVEHGLTITRDRVQTLAQAPADLLVSENAHARGFRLEGYGVFFDVVVPSFETTLDLESADARPERSRSSRARSGRCSRTSRPKATPISSRR